MITVEIKYKGKNKNTGDIGIVRKIEDENTVPAIIGEMLYGIECQTHTFETHEMYKQMLKILPNKVPTRKKKYLISDSKSPFVIKLGLVKKETEKK